MTKAAIANPGRKPGESETRRRGVTLLELVVTLALLALILGVFLFQIRERFDSLDIHHLEKLRED